MRFSVRVPASSANLGPGFDALALAVACYLTVDVVSCDEAEPRVVDEPDLRGGTNLVLSGMHRAAAAAGRPLPGCRVSVRSDIPVARGLGSSAAALVAGLLAGNRLLGAPLSQTQLLDLACEAEGHGDNVSAALLGGLTLVAPGAAGPIYRRVPIAHPLRAVVFVPHQTGLTRSAREVVPEAIPRADAVANAARCALLMLALTGDDPTLLGEAMVDRLHQPYRVTLFPYLPELIAAARAHGAYGASLSGAGPSVLALTAPDRAAAVAEALAAAAARQALPGDVLDLAIDTTGASIVAD